MELIDKEKEFVSQIIDKYIKKRYRQMKKYPKVTSECLEKIATAETILKKITDL